LGTAILALAIFALVAFGQNAAGLMGHVAEAARGVTNGSSLPQLARDVAAASGWPLALFATVAGMTIAAAICALFGRLTAGPLWRRYGLRLGPPKLGPDGMLPRWLRIMMMILPPPPMPKTNGESPMVRFGFWIVAALHLLPPPGPAFFRPLADVILGATVVRPPVYLAGAMAGNLLHVVIGVQMSRTGFTPPPPPSGWGMLGLLVAPILVMGIFRAAKALYRRLTRS
jgi:hypothetical protein